MLETVLKLAEPALAAATPQAAGEAFFKGAQALGASYLQGRIYRRPDGRLTSERHFAAGGVVSRLCRPGWVGSTAFNYICFDHNPLLNAIRKGLTRYRFSDFAPHAEARHGDYWDAMSEAGIGEALCATAYGDGRRIASLHLGFERRSFAPDEAAALQVAGMAYVEKLLSFEDYAPARPDTAVALTARERDALAYVAEGKTDWEIGVILGVAEATARFHVDNARKKLGAANRAHAVARFLATEGQI